MCLSESKINCIVYYGLDYLHAKSKKIILIKVNASKIEIEFSQKVSNVYLKFIKVPKVSIT